MDGLGNTQWLLWLAAALTAGIIELVSLDFFFIMVAGGALVAAAAAALDAPVPLQVIIFAVSTAGLLFGARPPLKHWAQKSTPAVTMNAAALVGRDAQVLESVTDHTGLVKLNGEVWTARVAPGYTQLEVGSAVLVVRIDGATAVVAPESSPPATNFLEGNPTS